MPHPADTAPQGPVETTVYLPSSTLVGLRIRGVRRETMLGIREDLEGTPLTCAITNDLRIDTSRVQAWQSNVRRTKQKDDLD